LAVVFYICAQLCEASTKYLVSNVCIIFNIAPIFVILGYIHYLSYCLFMIHWILIKVMLI